MTNSLLLFFLALFISVPLSSLGQSARVKKEPKKPWVEQVEFDHRAKPHVEQESSYYYLLLDQQENISTEESFSHTVYKILSNEGLQEMSDLSFDFDPSYAQLIVHAVLIHRGDEVINQLPKEIKTLQREESMDRFLYDGSITAVINLTDVRVGDIVEYSFTRKGYNPVFDHDFSRWINFEYSIAIEKNFHRLVAPAALDLSFKYLNSAGKPEIKKEGNLVSYTWVNNKMNAVLRDNNEPDWYYPYKSVLISSFKNWGEVVQWASDRYHISEQEKQEVVKKFMPNFKSSDPEEYALEVIHFVQDEIRYLGFESGLNSHKPHSPAQVYNQRFGDCKDKSLLLSALLNAKGIESYPVLVNTIYRNALSEQIPLINSFNHCVVQIVFNGKTYYIDPTISSQGGNLNNYYFPTYGKGLVVKPGTTDLVDFPEHVTSSVQEIQTFDLASVGGEGMLRIETTYKGGEADNQRSYYANTSLEAIQKGYLSYYGNLYPDIQKFEKIQIEDNRKDNTFKVKEKYKIPTFWKPYPEREGTIYSEFYALSLESYFNVSKAASRTSPYSLSYPFHFSHEIHVMLPEEWSIAPEKNKIETDQYQYDHQIIYNDKYLSLLTNYSTKSTSVPVENFGKFVEDHLKMKDNLNYIISYDASIVKKTSSRMPGALVTTFSMVFGIALSLWLFYKYDPVPHYPAAWATPIGGWLVLVAIGTCLNPIILFYSLAFNDALISGQSWLTMWHTSQYGYFIFILFEHIYNVVFLLFSILLAILFFQRRSSLPRLISISFACACFMTVLDSWVAFQLDPNAEIPFKDVFRSIVVAAIWIPYFNISQRVKRTFVNVREPRNGTDDMIEQTT